MKTIVDGAGSRFDPVVVAALQALHQQGAIERIRGEVANTAD